MYAIQFTHCGRYPNLSPFPPTYFGRERFARENLDVV